jgi:hypothetical protein
MSQKLPGDYAAQNHHDGCAELLGQLFAQYAQDDSLA